MENSDNTRDIAAFMRTQVVPESTSRYGLVIGIDHYHDERLNLRCAVSDAQAIYNLMIDPECGLFNKQHVTLLLDDMATREQTWRALAGLRKKATSNDTVWIYYAGHGAPEADDFYWVPYDGDVDDLYSTGLSRRELNHVLGDLKAERIVVFMDCCHAAAMTYQKNRTRDVITAEDAFASYKGKGRLIFAASDGRQKSIEITDKGRGAFSYFLEEGLRGEADISQSGIVTADSLWSYLKDKVSNAAQKAGNPQSPVRIGEETHDFALSLNPLEFGRRKRIADAIKTMVGVGKDQLTTEEAHICLDILRFGPSTAAQQDLMEEFSALVDGKLRIKTFKRLLENMHDSSPNTASNDRHTAEKQKSQRSDSPSINVVDDKLKTDVAIRSEPSHPDKHEDDTESLKEFEPKFLVKEARKKLNRRITWICIGLAACAALMVLSQSCVFYVVGFVAVIVCIGLLVAANRRDNIEAEFDNIVRKMMPYLKRGEVDMDTDLERFGAEARRHGSNQVTVLADAFRARGLRIGSKDPEVKLIVRDIVQGREETITGEGRVLWTNTEIDIIDSATGECIHTWKHWDE
jgi:hypothetical protein